MRDPYAVLGVPRSATSEEIKTLYRRLAKELHPDGNKNDPKAAAAFAELNAAYEILGDEDKRKAFDRGEIDARGQRRRRALAHAKHPRQSIVAGLMIILLMLAATITRTLTTSEEIHVNNSVKGTVLPRAVANDGHADAARPQQEPDRSAESMPHLVLQQSASYTAANALPLGIQVRGEAFGLAVEISGLPTGMTISAGRELGVGKWRILATDVGNAILQPPPGFGGTIDLTVELRLADDILVDRRSLRLRLLRVRTVVPDQIESVGGMAVSGVAANKAMTSLAATDQNATAAEPQLAHEQIELLVARSQELISQGDVGAARTLLRRAAEARDARATLALGATYDPVMLAIIRAQGVTPDASLARDWYKKASEFGSQEAQERLNLLGR
jgi:hypothetical protein